MIGEGEVAWPGLGGEEKVSRWINVGRQGEA